MGRQRRRRARGRAEKGEKTESKRRGGAREQTGSGRDVADKREGKRHYSIVRPYLQILTQKVVLCTHFSAYVFPSKFCGKSD
eukprot:658523-Pleurochrysis_carterae.AAC.3